VASAPKAKFSLGFDYNKEKFGYGAHFTLFGKVKLLGFGDGEAPPGDNPITQESTHRYHQMLTQCICAGSF
jgi:hypothetical protein